jgi:biopolymer transport protein ExbD
MRIPSRTVSSDVGFNMTPMIDVVFQLTIFFLLSSHLSKQEKELALPLPAAASAARQAADDRPRLTVNVLADGRVVVSNRVTTLADLAGLLAERSRTHGERLEVRLRGDRRVAYGQFEPVMLACAKAGIWNVAYVVEAK